MTGKVRYVDWSPDEYIAGTFGRLTFEEHGFYIVALNMIYSSGGHIPVELNRLAHAGCCRPQTAQRLMDRLIAKGKLTLTADGRLANGRADKEIHKAHQRIANATEAGVTSGSLRTQHAVSRKRLKENRGVSRTRVHITNYQPSISSLSESLTDAARDPAPDQTAPGRAPAKRDPRLEALAAKARAKFLKGES